MAVSIMVGTGKKIFNLSMLVFQEVQEISFRDALKI